MWKTTGTVSELWDHGCTQYQVGGASMMMHGNAGQTSHSMLPPHT